LDQPGSEQINAEVHAENDGSCRLQSRRMSLFLLARRWCWAHMWELGRFGHGNLFGLCLAEAAIVPKKCRRRICNDGGVGARVDRSSSRLARPTASEAMWRN
jgi:hypothetical protein